MKFSPVFCGFLLVWHSGNVFVRSADPPPSTLPATPGGTNATTTPTQINTTSPSSTTPSPSATPGGTNATTTPTQTNATSPSSPTPSASAIPGGTNATTTPTRTNATSPSSPTPVASTSATVPSLTNATGTSKPSENVTKITTPGPAVSTASTPAQGDVTTVSCVTTTGSTTVAVTTTTPPTTPTTPSPNTTPPTTAPLTIKVIISETNLLLADINFFIELSGPANRSLSGITLVVYNATDNTELENVTFGAEHKLKTNGLYVHNLKNDTWKNLDTALLVLYKPGSSGGEVMDFIIASGSTSAANSISPALKEKLGLENKLIIIVNKRKLATMNISGDISLIRCVKGGKHLIISYRSMDAVNNCTFPNDTQHGFEFKVVASGCMKWDESITMKLQDEIINNVNRICQCGMTSSLFYHDNWTPKDSCSSNKEESTTNILSGKFVSMFANQTSAIQEAYTTFVMTSPNITVGALKFTVTNCSLVCMLPAPHIPSKDKGNISMTVAVVLSCIAVFLIILVAVVIYLRRQRRGVHQFRMTRLAEDDDMDDMEDFVGGPMDDHEPSFNNSHYKASG